MKKSWNPFQRLWSRGREEGLPASLSAAGTETNPRHIAFLRSLAKDFRSANNSKIPLENLDVVVVDLETTGFRPYHGDEIISIGAVAMRGAEVLKEESFSSLVNSARSVPEHIELLTGISSDELSTAPDLASTLSRFFQFVGSRPLVAHHSRHEREFLRAALWKTSRVTLEHRLLDTMMLIHLSAGPLGNATLDTLCAINDIEIERRHDALCDAVATARLWSVYLQRAISLGYSDLRQVYENHP